MRFLVDMGAQIKLVRPDITPLTLAKQPLCLQTVDRSAMEAATGKHGWSWKFCS